MSKQKIVPYNILVIDDDQDDHFFIKNAIRETDLNINLVSVYNGLQGLEVLTRSIVGATHNLPDLIICDINMPIMNGVVFLEKVKKSKTLMHIPVFILSTHCDEATKKKLFELGVTECVIKPIYSSNYKVVIADMLNKIESF